MGFHVSHEHKYSWDIEFEQQMADAKATWRLVLRNWLGVLVLGMLIIAFILLHFELSSGQYLAVMMLSSAFGVFMGSEFVSSIWPARTYWKALQQGYNDTQASKDE